MIRRTNLIGMKFGRLTVVEFSHRCDRGNSNYWKCSCECGNSKIVIARTADLKRGHVSSCGCYCLEKKSESKKQNDYIKYDEYFTGKIGEKFFYIDIEDYELVKNYCWSISNGYARTKRKKKWISMHRLVMKLNDKDYIVDHINHNTLDNRKENLRICTQRENSFNRGYCELKEFGVFGVRQNKYGKYECGIGYEGVWIYLGCFDTSKDAVETRIAKEIELYGKFSPHYNNIEIKRD